jgi:hypothetical protein
MDELRGAPKVSAEQQIWAARAAVNGSGDTGRPRSRPRGQLRFWDLALAGEADGRTRTGDPFITSEVLYQLSYVGEKTCKSASSSRTSGGGARAPYCRDTAGGAMRTSGPCRP